MDERRSPRRRRHLSSIGNKLLVTLVAVALLPTVAVSIYALRSGAGALSDLELTQRIDSTSRDAGTLSREMGVTYERLRQLAANRSLRRCCETIRDLSQPDSSPFTESGKAEFETQTGQARFALLSLLRSDEHIHSVLVHAVPGTGPAHRLFRASSGMLMEPLYDLREEPTADSETPRWNLRWRSDPPTPTDEEVREALAQEVKRHPLLGAQRCTVETEDGALESFLVSIFDEEQRKVGSIILNLSWRSLLESRCRAAAGATATARVDAALFQRPLRAISRTDGEAPLEIPAPLIDAASEGRSGAHVSPQGSLISFAPVVPPGAATHEFLVLAFHRLTSREEIAAFRLVFTAVLSGALVFALLLGTWLSRRLTRPLRLLRSGARTLGSGELEHRIEVRSRDEVAEVAEAFNNMATELHSTYEGMEKTIDERTEQLQGALDELRAAHAELVDSEARYADIVENASDLIQVTDPEGRILRANRREAEILGLEVGELVGRDFFELVAADEREATRHAFEEVRRGRTLRSYPSALAVADGGRVPVEISATPILRDDRFLGVRAILRDVRERKEMEAQLIRAERLSSVGALAAGVAHEINNPLGIITMFAQRVLERAKAGEVDVDKLEKIVDQAGRVAQITRGLLDFSRAGPTEFQPFSLSECVRQTVALVEERARRSRIAIEVEEAAALPRARGNSQQISQVLLNLILNALHAIGENGRVLVRIETSTAGRLHVVVEDDGPGIAEDALPHLFEPFFTTKEPGEGTGLGLSVSYGILKDHQSTLNAANRPEGGARFNFELPVAEAQGA